MFVYKVESKLDNLKNEKLDLSWWNSAKMTFWTNGKNYFIAQLKILQLKWENWIDKTCEYNIV